MAKITIAGRTATIVSQFTLDQIQLLERYRPDVLVLKDEYGEPTFMVATSCKGSVDELGIAFADETFGNKKACVTVAGCGCYEDAKEFVVEEIGGAILNLNKIERKIPAALDDIEAELEAIRDSVEVLN